MGFNHIINNKTKITFSAV